MDLINKSSRDPKTIRIDHKVLTVPTVEQAYYEIRGRSKTEALTRLIDLHDLKLGIIFCNTKRMVDDLTDELVARGYSADRIHGDMSQAQRELVMTKFRNSGLEFLVAKRSSFHPVQPGPPCRRPFEEAHRWSQAEIITSEPIAIKIKKCSLAMLGLAAGCRYHRWQLAQREAFRLCFRLSLLYNRLLASRRDSRFTPLDDTGKSVKRQLAAQLLSKQLGLNLFGSKPATNESYE